MPVVSPAVFNSEDVPYGGTGYAPYNPAATSTLAFEFPSSTSTAFSPQTGNNTRYLLPHMWFAANTITTSVASATATPVDQPEGSLILGPLAASSHDKIAMVMYGAAPESEPSQVWYNPHENTATDADIAYGWDILGAVDTTNWVSFGPQLSVNGLPQNSADFIVPGSVEVRDGTFSSTFPTVTVVEGGAQTIAAEGEMVMALFMMGIYRTSDTSLKWNEDDDALAKSVASWRTVTATGPDGTGGWKTWSDVAVGETVTPKFECGNSTHSSTPWMLVTFRIAPGTTEQDMPVQVIGNSFAASENLPDWPTMKVPGVDFEWKPDDVFVAVATFTTTTGASFVSGGFWEQMDYTESELTFGKAHIGLAQPSSLANAQALVALGQTVSGYTGAPWLHSFWIRGLDSGSYVTAQNWYAASSKTGLTIGTTADGQKILAVGMVQDDDRIRINTTNSLMAAANTFSLRDLSTQAVWIGMFDAPTAGSNSSDWEWDGANTVFSAGFAVTLAPPTAFLVATASADAAVSATLTAEVGGVPLTAGVSADVQVGLDMRALYRMPAPRRVTLYIDDIHGNRRTAIR